MSPEIHREVRHYDKTKLALAESPSISANGWAFYKDVGMALEHDRINRKLGLDLQIEILRRSLAENEALWKASGFGAIKNPVADSLRRDLAEKEAMLAQDSTDSIST